MCYFETKNLNGETNLKHKLTEKYSQNLLKNENLLDDFKCEIKCDDPNPIIYTFNGILKHEHHMMVLSYEQLLLRGSSLRNTEWIVGICTYSGHETKIMLNSPKARSKFSNLEIGVNRQIVTIFIVQFFLCAFCATYYILWFNSNKSDTEDYLDLEKMNKGQVYVFFINYFSWMLLFGNFVPISLLVTLELVKFLQASFIASDLDMYYEPIDISPGVQSSNLNEDLGQISYVFSDKTGTLTCNVMEFKRLCIQGESYGTESHIPPQNKLPHVDFVDPKFNPKLDASRELLLHLAICHTIICEHKDGGVEYKVSSPDELALVNAARYFGIQYDVRDDNQSILVKADGKTLVFEVLNIIEFNSDRKRMTIIARMPNGKVRLYIKGADSVIWPLISSDLYKKETMDNLEAYACHGLRTLVLAYRDLSDLEYQKWNNAYLEAMQDIKNKEARIDSLALEVEKDLKLVGATAIEDKLQDKVPETIKIIREAGVKIWVLTGDKIEAAINIGFSCNLLTSEMLRITIVGGSTSQVEQEIKDGLESMKEAPGAQFSLVISGEALLRALRPEIKPNLLKLAESCTVVLACRVSPQQKADIVKMIREAHPKVRTLSIGDGANDVNMITAAHVGIGIAGLEGKQAVRASDYSFAQFSYLHKLMFVHGRECYRRNSNLICFNFYKNVLLILPLFYVGTLSAFSAQVFYNTWVQILYNFLFSSVPIGFYAIFDRELEKDILLNDPSHYKIGLQGTLFSTKVFWTWIFEAAAKAGFLLYGTIFSLGIVSGDSLGRMSSLSVMSVMVFALVVFSVNIKVFMLSYTHFWFTILPIFIGIFLYFTQTGIMTEALPVSEYLLNFDGYGSLGQLVVNPNTYIWLVIALYGSFFIQPVIKSIMRIRVMRKDNIKVDHEDSAFKSELIEKKSVLETEEEKAHARSSLARYSQKCK